MDSRPRPRKRARVQGVCYRSRDLRIDETVTGTETGEDRVKRPGRPGQGRDLGLGLLATNLAWPGDQPQQQQEQQTNKQNIFVF